MVPKLHAKGHSFRGAAAYLLHDKGSAETSHRVAWVETVNLSTTNPQTAWRVMAATAMDANRLKEAAGVRKTGRTSKDAVLHLTLSWSPEQKMERHDMSSFAKRALSALKAEDRQAMIICHDDENHQHVHVLLNRISPTDGRMLSSSHEKSALSALALAYERECGAVLCKQREENAKRREKGEFVRGEEDIPRPEFEAMRKEQKKIEQEMPARIVEQDAALITALRSTLRNRLRIRLEAVRKQFRSRWREVYAKEREAQKKQEQDKSSLIAAVKARLRSDVKPPTASLPFHRQSVEGLRKLTAGYRVWRAERTLVNRDHRAATAAALADIGRDYSVTLKRLILRHDHEYSAAASLKTPVPTPAASQLVEQQRLRNAIRQDKEREQATPTRKRYREPGL